MKGVHVFWSLVIVVAVVRVAFSFDGRKPDIGQCLGQKIHGIANVVTDPERRESGQTMVIRTTEFGPIDEDSGESLCGENIDIRIKTKIYPRYHYGDEVYFSGNVYEPFNFSDEDGRVFDYRNYLAKDDIFFEIKSADLKLKESKSSGELITSILFTIKRGFVDNLERVLGEPHGALAAGLVVGEKSALGADLLQDFRIVGLIHIVVLSGFNITIVADALRRLLSRLPRVWGIAIGAVGMISFGVMVGGGATVVRSCVMASIALFADLIRRDYDVSRALWLAGLVMVIHNPLILLHDPSFQLSFLATLGLIMFASPIEKKLFFLPERLGLRSIVAATLATQITVAPYIFYMMGQLSIVGTVVNILVLPIIPVTMLAIFLSGISGFVWLPISQLFGWASHFLLSYELVIVDKFASLPFAAITVGKFSFWWVVGFYVGLVAVIFLLKKKH